MRTLLWVVMITIALAVVILFGDCSPTLAQYQRVPSPAQMEVELEVLKESSMNIILQECERDYQHFYYCSMSRMYAMRHIIRYYNDILYDSYFELRDADDLADDFEALNEMMEHWSRETDFGDGTFNFMAVLNDYDNIYLPSKYGKEGE